MAFCERKRLLEFDESRNDLIMGWACAWLHRDYLNHRSDATSIIGSVLPSNETFMYRNVLLILEVRANLSRAALYKTT